MRSILVGLVVICTLLPMATSKISCFIDRHGGSTDECDYCGFLNLTARVNNQTYTDVNYQCYNTIGVIGGLLIPHRDMCQRMTYMGYGGGSQTVESYICFENLCNSFCNAAGGKRLGISLLLCMFLLILITN